MGDTSSVLSIWSSLSTKIKQFVGDLTKSAVRKKKMNIYSIDTLNQTVTVYESSNPTVLITVPYRVESAISRMSAGQSVMVEWTYDDFSTAVAVAPGKGWATLAEVQEAIGTGGGSGDYYTLSINGRTITLVGTASSSSSVTVPDTDLSNYYTKSQANTLLSGKADTATTLAGYGITNAYTKDTVDTLLLAKADTATTLAGYGIADAYTKTQVDSALSGKQNALTFDSTPTQGSTNPVTSGGVYSAISNIPAIDAYTKTETNALLAGKQNTLTFDTEPTAMSLNPVTSAGIYDTFDSVYSQIDSKQAKLTFDSTPTQNSTNPVTSGGVYTALGNKANKATTLSGYGITDAYSSGTIDTLLLAKQDTLSFDTTPTNGSSNPVTSDGIYDALQSKANTSTTLAGYGITNAYTKTEVDALIPTVPTMGDYVTEEGTDGNWTYRKWDSGISECWGYYDVSGAECDTASGSLYVTGAISPNMAFPTGVFANDSTLNVQMCFHSSQGYPAFVWIAASANPSVGATPFRLMRPTSTTISGRMEYSYKGRWKS